MMAVRVLRPSRAYWNFGVVELHRHEVIDGEFGVHLAAHCPDVEVIGDPEPEPVTPPVSPESGPVVAPVPPAPPEEPQVPEPPAQTAPSAEADVFDPAAHTGPEVIEYAKAHPDLRESLRVAEMVGKARTTVLAHLA